MTNLLKAADAMAEALRLRVRRETVYEGCLCEDCRRTRNDAHALAAYEAAKREAEADKTTVLCHNIGLTI